MNPITTAEPPARAVAVPRHRTGIVLISLLIAGFLLVQTAVAFKAACPPDFFPQLAFLKVACDPAVYPILSYPMYSAARYPDEPVPQFRLIGVFSDGSESEITHETLQITYFQWFYAVDAAYQEDVFTQLVALGAWYRDHFNLPLTHLRLENHPVRVNAAADDAPLDPIILDPIALPPAEDAS